MIYFSIASGLCQRRDVILDADTGNEVDDLYAIVQLVESKSVNLVGVTSAHFNNVQLLTDSMWNAYPTAGINTVQLSQELIEVLLSLHWVKSIFRHPVAETGSLVTLGGTIPGRQYLHLRR